MKFNVETDIGVFSESGKMTESTARRVADRLNGEDHGPLIFSPVWIGNGDPLAYAIQIDNGISETVGYLNWSDESLEDDSLDDEAFDANAFEEYLDSESDLPFNGVGPNH